MIKRLFDIVIAGIALILLSPVFVFLVWQVRRKMGSPVLFRQIRPGRDGKPFEMVKLRTMGNAKDKDGNLLPDAERLTSFGKFLRATSLDELPELWNVLKGDMSLVGPRPLLMEYLALYTPEQARRHEVRPGITGWAQIKQGYDTSIDDVRSKVRYDLFYIENMSFRMDIKILLMTVYTMIAGKGN